MDKTVVRNIRVWANVGLIGSLVMVVIAILFKYATKVAFYQSPEVFRTLTIVAAVAVVLQTLFLLTSVRKGVPKLRQKDDVDEKLNGYASMVKTNGLCTMIITALVSGIIILLGNYNLLMLDMLLVLMLFFTYPNMYKIKVDLGLTDDQMSLLFGDQYVPDSEEETSEMEDPLEKKK